MLLQCFPSYDNKKVQPKLSSSLEKKSAAQTTISLFVFTRNLNYEFAVVSHFFPVGTL